MATTTTTTPQVRMDIPPWTFGDRLRKARRAAGLSQAELAKLLGVGTSRLSGWEADASRPRDIIAVARQVEDATGIPADWLVGLSTAWTLALGLQGEPEAIGAAAA